jgi:hypothetical protein
MNLSCVISEELTKYDFINLEFLVILKGSNNKIKTSTTFFTHKIRIVNEKILAATINLVTRLNRVTIVLLSNNQSDML